MTVDQLKAWITRTYWTAAQVGGFVNQNFFRKGNHQRESAGAASAGQPIILNETGKIDGSFVSEAASLTIDSNTLRLTTSRTPASAAAAGNAGDICWDGNYVYVCVATNTWKRAAIATW